jgi:lysophospholipase L1-like esterase
MPQIVHRPAPGVGFEMIPGQRGFTFASPATINSIGLRGPEIELAKAPDQLRVLCLGDSITFGVGVNDEIPYPRQLEAFLAERRSDRQAQVINAGVQKYSTYQEMDWLRKHGVSLEPDIVVLGMLDPKNWTTG